MSSPLARDPSLRADSLRDLLGLAGAAVEDAIERHTMLAKEMARRGDATVADALREIVEQERRRLADLAALATSWGEALPDGRGFRAGLPSEIAEHWQDAAAGSLLTAYRVLAMAVVDAERLSAFFAYVAAHAPAPEIARAAEHLAQDQLAHAAALRRLRRRAWRQTPDTAASRAAPRIEDLDGFRALQFRLEDEAAGVHAALADRLAAAGDMEGVGLLAGMADRAPAATRSRHGDTPFAEITPDRVWHEALAPLERMADIYERIAETATSEKVLAAAQSALIATVGRIATIAGRRRSPPHRGGTA